MNSSVMYIIVVIILGIIIAMGLKDRDAPYCRKFILYSIISLDMLVDFALWLGLNVSLDVAA